MPNSIYQNAVAKYRAALPAGELNEFALSDADRLGIHCHSAVFYPDNGPHKGGVGYGLAADAATCGAYGELTEDFWAHQALEAWPKIRASFAELKSRERKAIDPLDLCLEAGSLYDEHIELDWVEIEKLSGDKVLIPLEFVACGWSDLPEIGNPALGETRRGFLVTPITNGLGAGTTREMAVIHGLLELLQRDGNGLSIRALATTDAVDLSTIHDPVARELLDKFERAGVDVVVKLASTDRDIPGFYVSGLDRAEAENGGFPAWMMSGNLMASWMKKTGMLLPTRSQIPSFV